MHLFDPSVVCSVFISSAHLEPRLRWYQKKVTWLLPMENQRRTIPSRLSHAVPYHAVEMRQKCHLISFFLAPIISTAAARDVLLIWSMFFSRGQPLKHIKEPHCCTWSHVPSSQLTWTPVYFDSIPNTLSYYWKYSLEHQMCINPQLKIVPNKCTVYSVWVTFE